MMEIDGLYDAKGRAVLNQLLFKEDKCSYLLAI